MAVLVAVEVAAPVPPVALRAPNHGVAIVAMLGRHSLPVAAAAPTMGIPVTSHVWMLTWMLTWALMWTLEFYPVLAVPPETVTQGKPDAVWGEGWGTLWEQSQAEAPPPMQGLQTHVMVMCMGRRRAPRQSQEKVLETTRVSALQRGVIMVQCCHIRPRE